MARRTSARRAIPALTLLERRLLLSFTTTWIGQDGSDFVGTTWRTPNDYQDIHIQLSGLKAAGVAEIQVQRYSGDAWDYTPASSTSAFFQAAPTDPTRGDLYLEPYHTDPAGFWYELIRVKYNDGSYEDSNFGSATPVDANLRVPGRGLTAQWLGQDGHDWTGTGPSVGPDGIQDFHLKVSHISAGASLGGLVLTASPGTAAALSWQIGTNPQGYSNAELLNRVTSGGMDAADLFGNPSPQLKNGAPLTLRLTYSDPNRGGKSDTVPIAAGLKVANINPSLAMPGVAVANFAVATAHSTPQDAGFPGNSHVVLDILPRHQTRATVQAAVLSNQAGTTWAYGPSAFYTGDPPWPLSYDPSLGTFSFPPLRDESSATLTLRLVFNDGTQAVARFAGTASVPNRRDSPVGASAATVTTADQLVNAVAGQVANIHLAAGVYPMSEPLNLNYPARITADPGANLVFMPSPGDPSWTNATGAIGVWASHISLDGFAISFQGDSASWANTDSKRAVIQSAGRAKVGLAYTNLNIQAPAAHAAGEDAVNLMNFDINDSGQIVGDTLKGGTISLGNGPWQIANNDYQGAPANAVTHEVFFVLKEHDVTISGNHLHSVAPAGVTQRFLVLGAGDSGRGFNDLIRDNTVDGGIGRPATDGSNNPEIILTEQYQPRFEGTPSAVSPDGYVVQVPSMRGPDATTGDVVAILSGPQAGQWRLIAQALGSTRYLLDSPLPTGHYAIAITRGWVNDTYQGNTIDLGGTNPGNVALDLLGGHFGTQVLNNTFLGANAINVSAAPTEGAFSGTNPPDWGWTHLPIFGLVIDGNTFQDAAVSLNVAHSRYIKSNSGRVYFKGSFTKNVIKWSAGSQPGVTVGVPAQNGEAAYTRPNFSWLDDGELVLTLQGNWGVGPSGAAATIQVIAGTIFNGSSSPGTPMENQTLTLPTSPPA